MTVEKTIRAVCNEDIGDLSQRLEILVRQGLMPYNTLPILKRALMRLRTGIILQGAERDVLTNFINAMLYMMLGNETIFQRAKLLAKEEFDMGALENILEGVEDLSTVYVMEEKGYLETDLKKRKKNNDKAIKDMKKMGSPMKNPAFSEEVEQVEENRQGIDVTKMTKTDSRYKPKHTHYIVKNKDGKVVHHEVGKNHSGSHEMDTRHSLRKENPGHTVHSFDMDTDNKKAAQKHLNSGKVNEGVEQIDEVLEKDGPKRPEFKVSPARVKAHTNVGSPANKYIDKKVKERDAMNQKNDPGAAKQGKALSVLDRAKAVKKAHKKGVKWVSPYDTISGHKPNKMQLAQRGLTKEEVEQIDEVLPALAGVAGRALATRAVGAGASTATKRIAGTAGSYAGKKVADKVTSTNEEVEQVAEGRTDSDMSPVVPTKTPATSSIDKYKKNVKDLAQSKLKPIKLTKGWGDGGKSMKSSYGKVMGTRKEEAMASIEAVKKLNESYKATFDLALEQFGVKSPSELDEEKRKEFFNFVDQNYKKGD